MALFSLGKQSIPTPEESYNKLLGIDNEEKETIVEIGIDLLDEIKDQPFKYKPEKAEQIAESVATVGILDPLIVRKKRNGRYDIIAGRHRKGAAQICGLKTVPCIIKEVSKDIAELILLSTNTDRNNDYAPSELAAAYKQQSELLKRIGSNVPSVAKIAEENNTNRRTIQRYIRLNLLIPPLLKLVDKNELPFSAGVSLTYLSNDAQQILFTYMLDSGYKVSVEKGEQLKKAFQDAEEFTVETVKRVFGEDAQPENYPSLPFPAPTFSAEPVAVIATKQPDTAAAQPEVKPPVSAKTEAKTENAQKQRKKEEPQKEASATEEGYGLSVEIIKEAIKKHYSDRKDIYRYYIFCVPTTKEAIQAKLKPYCGYSGGTILFDDKSSGYFNSYSSYIEVTHRRKKSQKIPYTFVDRCIREMIVAGNWIDAETTVQILHAEIQSMGGKTS